MALSRTLISSTESAEIVRLRLVSGGLKVAVNLTGSIYPMNRPLNSGLEDIVVSTLAMNADQMQEGVINVNIHLPNLSISGDSTQPNLPRFQSIATACLALLDDVWGSDFNLEIEDPGIVQRDGNNWFCNIRIRFYAPREDILN